MSRRLAIFCAVVIVIGLAIPAFAAVQNVKVGGDILIRGVARNNMIYNDDLDLKQSIRAAISAVRVRLDADLTDNVAATVRLLNERVWAKEGYTGSDISQTTSAKAADTEVDIDLAYVTLKEFLYSPLTLVVGRQELRYGNALIIGDIDTNATATINSNLPGSSTTVVGLRDLSVRKSFDAIKAVLNYNPLTIDIVYAVIEENNISINNDVNLMGVNASYPVNKDLSTEAYLWSRDRQWGSTALTTAPGQGERLNTAGARAVYTGFKDLTLGLEGALQFGDHLAYTALYPDEQRTAGTKSRVNAYGIQMTSSYALPKVKYTPTVGFNYTQLSGDKPESTSDNYKGWDPMFEDQAGGTIYNRVLGYSNCQNFNVFGTMKPMDDVTVRLDWTSIKLLKAYSSADLTTNLSGLSTDATTTVKADKKSLANEVDLGITYDYTEDVQLGLNAGVYFPGAVYDKINKKNATQLIGSMKVTF